MLNEEEENRRMDERMLYRIQKKEKALKTNQYKRQKKSEETDWFSLIQKGVEDVATTRTDTF